MGNLKKNETGTNWFIERYPDPFMTIMKTHLDCSSADPSERYRNWSEERLIRAQSY